VTNDEAAIDALIDDASGRGTAVLVIDQTGSAALLLEAAAKRGVPVAYVPGLVMRRAADLYTGAAKTDPKAVVSDCKAIIPKSARSLPASSSPRLAGAEPQVPGLAAQGVFARLLVQRPLGLRLTAPWRRP